MRLDHQIIQYLKNIIGETIPGAKLYLFGSRTDDSAKGGDIDLMILTHQPVDKRILRIIRVGFYQKFGWQKIDLVNFTYKDETVFKQIIQTNAIQF